MSDGTLFIEDSRSGKKYEIPIRHNTVLATDLKKIKASSVGANRADKVGDGLRLYDPGLENTTVVETNMTYADADRGLLMFRGYALEQLWESEFEDMLHLMVWGKYPTPSQSQSLRKDLASLMSDIPKTVFEVIETFPRDCPPMPMLVAGLAAYLSNDLDSIPTFNGGNIFHGNVEKTDEAILKTVAAFASVVGIAGSYRRGIEFTPPSLDKGYLDNLFTMMGIVDPGTKSPAPEKLDCFRRFTIINTDHGMALSAFAHLVATSALADPISGLIGSLVAAYGPLHFGAPEAAYKTIKNIGGPENVPAFLDEVKSGKRRLFGYGHRTYRTVDPRLAPIKSALQTLNVEKDIALETAYEIDRLAATDDYFLKRGLHANADFYTPYSFIKMGFHPEEFPIAMFAQRIIGIMAHWREAMLRKVKLFRPTHIYTGETEPVEHIRVPSKL